MNFKILNSVLMGAAAFTVPAKAAQHAFHFDHVLGTSLDIVVVAADAKIAGLAAETAMAEITRLDAVLSGWRHDSELRALNNAAIFHASPDLFNVVASGEKWRADTDGAFSLRLGRLEAAPDFVDRGLLASAIADAPIRLYPATRRIERPEPVSFAVDGLAKGYIIDRALEAASAMPGVLGLMIDVGGDLRCWGQSPDGTGWRIGVVDHCSPADNSPPVAVLKMTQGAVATSGRSTRQQAIFDPRNGQPVRTIAMATVVAPTAADADALASAFSVLTPQQSIGLANGLPGVAAHIVDSQGRTHASDAWQGMVVAQNTVPRQGSAAGAWPAGFGVNIAYEIPNLGGGRRARPPYVTVWITNEAGTAVRTLAFYADRVRYMPENYVFWERVGGGHQDLVASVTRPTRPPGRYTLEWDGRDDNGKPLATGKYTVNIEASREHGGHSLQRLDLAIGASPVSAEAAAQGELGAASATYGKLP